MTRITNSLFESIRQVTHPVIAEAAFQSNMLNQMKMALLTGTMLNLLTAKFAKFKQRQLKLKAA